MNQEPKIEKVSRFSPLDWILDYLLIKIADWILSRLARKVKGVNLKRVLVRLLGLLWSASPFLTVILGFIFQKEVLAAIGSPHFFWVGAGIVAVVSGGRVYVHFRAESRLLSFLNVVVGSTGHMYNIVIGGLARAAFDLSMGLLPFWENPWVFVVLGVYYFLIANVWLMKRYFGKMVRWKPTGYPVWRRLV